MKQLKYILSTILFVVGFVHSVSAQQGVIPTKISGTVLESASGKPLAGAKVSISGVTSSITDEKGKFNLAKKIKGAYLDIYAPGFAPKRIPLVNDSDIVVRLMDETFKGKFVGSYGFIFDYLTKDKVELRNIAINLDAISTKNKTINFYFDTVLFFPLQ